MSPPTDHDSMIAEWSRMHASKADALDAFNEAKFGLFIHWGLYAVPAGVWKGERMEDGGMGPCVSEWIMRRKSIPRAEYAALANQFNPVAFDAEEWAQTARDAGMRYMVLTSKHHDGFAMYRSEASGFNIVDATPFRRDPVQELHAACARNGLRLGLYYSHTADWTDGGDQGMQYEPEVSPEERAVRGNDWDPSPRSFDDYLENKSFPQLAELTRKYPDLFLIWFDGAGYIPRSISYRFYRTVTANAPKALVNSRVTRGDIPDLLCDYQSARDNHIPDREEVGNPYWETCGTMNNSWGFKSYDHDWKQPLEVLSWLVDVVSRGGNYLLNVGPDALGRIPAESVSILAEVGKWLRVNGEAIYGTRAWTTFHEGPTVLSREGTGGREKDGFSTSFSPEDFWFTQKDGTLYVMALAYPDDRRALVRSVKGLPVRSVRMLGTAEAVGAEKTPDGLNVVLPTRTSEQGYALALETGAAGKDKQD